MITYSEKIVQRHRIFVKETITLNNISILIGGLEYKVNEILNNSGNYGFVFVSENQIVGRCNKERFLLNESDKFEFI